MGTATRSKTKAAMVDLWTTLSNTSSPTHSCSSLSTHTTPREDTSASMFPPRVLVRSHPTRMLPKISLVNNSWPLLPRDQLPLPSKPIKWPSKVTTVVSSPTDVVRNSTTVSSLSAMVPRVTRTTSSSRTPGVHPGDLMDTSRSHQKNAVSPPLPHTLLSEIDQIFLKQYFLYK